MTFGKLTTFAISSFLLDTTFLYQFVRKCFPFRNPPGDILFHVSRKRKVLDDENVKLCTKSESLLLLVNPFRDYRYIKSSRAYGLVFTSRGNCKNKSEQTIFLNLTLTFRAISRQISRSTRAYFFFLVYR